MPTTDDTALRTEIGRRLHQARTHSKFKLREVVEELRRRGITAKSGKTLHTGVVASWERGIPPGDQRVIRELAKMYKVPAEWLYCLDTEEFEELPTIQADRWPEPKKPEPKKELTDDEREDAEAREKIVQDVITKLIQLAK